MLNYSQIRIQRSSVFLSLLFSIGLMTPVLSYADGYQGGYGQIFGNDYGSINAYGTNEDAFRKSNIIQRENGQTNVNIPNPTGEVQLNFLGNKTSISLGNGDLDKDTRRRKAIAAQKRRNLQQNNLRRAEEERTLALQRQRDEEARVAEEEINAEKQRLAAIAQQQQQAQTQYQQINNYSSPLMGGTSVPNSLPRGIPRGYSN